MHTQFGTEETTRVIDSNGSTETLVENIRDWETVKPSRRKFAIRKKVTSQAQEFEEYYAFSDELAKDKSKLEPAFRIERSKVGDDNGFYYVVRCYTQLEY